MTLYSDTGILFVKDVTTVYYKRFFSKVEEHPCSSTVVFNLNEKLVKLLLSDFLEALENPNQYIFWLCTLYIFLLTELNEILKNMYTVYYIFSDCLKIQYVRNKKKKNKK